jgi:hypothetical protein
MIYIIQLFVQKPFLLFLVSFSFWKIIKVVIRKNIESNLSLILLFSVIVVSLSIPIYSGGDHFGLHRFIVPFIPVIILTVVLILREFDIFIGKTKLILFLILLFFSNMYNFRDTLVNRSYPIRHEWAIAVYGRSNSERLNDFFKANKRLPSQGVLVAGGTAYGYNGETIDLLGLNNTKMAHADRIKDKSLPKNHASFNADVFFELSPDLFWYQHCGFINQDKLVPERIQVNKDDWSSKVFKNIQLDKRFIERYGFFRIVNLNHENDALQIFANKNFVSTLDTSIYKIIEIPYE